MLHSQESQFGVPNTPGFAWLHLVLPNLSIILKAFLHKCHLLRLCVDLTLEHVLESLPHLFLLNQCNTANLVTCSYIFILLMHASEYEGVLGGDDT